jgi:HAE1 family hydrophobic/amphiphilic exporter-1
MNFVRFFTRRPVTTVMIFLALLMFGAYGYYRMPKEQFAQVDVPYVTVITIYAGAGPEEIETQVTEKIEEAVATVSGLKQQRSISQDGVSYIVAEFEIEVSGTTAENDVRSKIDQIINDLPTGADRPITAKLEIGAKAIAQVAVVAPRPVEEIYKLADDKILDRFTQINGLASVDVFGEKEREIVISLSPKKLEAYGLSIVDVNSLIAAFNLKMPLGRVVTNEQELSVRLQSEFASLEAVQQLKIPTTKGVLRLADIATIEDSFEEVRNMARMNGKSAIGLSLTKSSDANTLQIMAKVRKLIAQFKQELPDDYELILASDNSTVIQASIDDVISNLIVGILLTAGVLLVFLHQPRLTLIATITLPIAVIATFAVMYASGFSANMLSLMGMALSVGVLVANVIVVLENIQRIQKETGDAPLIASENGTAEIFVAVSASALTNVAVFLPIAIMPGLAGRFFRQFGLTVTYATFFSLLLSFSLTPMLASRILKAHGQHKGFFEWFGRKWEAFYGVWEKWYGATLAVTLRFRWITIFVTLCLFVASFGCLQWIGSELFTSADEGEITIALEKAIDESITGTSNTLLLIEERLKTFPYVKTFYTTVGGAETSTKSVNEGEIVVSLVDRKLRALSTMQIAAEFRRAFADIPGATLTITSTSSGPGGGKPLSLQVSGQNLDDLFSVSNQLIQTIRQIPGAVDVGMDWRLGKPEIRITPDYLHAADYGITPAQIASILRTSFTGSVSSSYRVSGKEYDIRVELSETARLDVAAIAAIPIQTPKGVIRLDALATIATAESPSKIYRTDRQRAITIEANISSGYNLGNVMTVIRKEIATMKLPQGITVAFSGSSERMGEIFTNMGLALLMAIALTYMLVASLLESAIHAVTIMSTLPLGLIGVLAALALTGKTLNMFSIMGVIMLVGIVVNNGILQIDYIQELRRKGAYWRDILVSACTIKLRPILMTNIAAIVSMIPLSLGIGQSGEMLAPMAVASIGGLLSSTVMTLYIVPVLYSLIEGFREFIIQRRSQENGEEKIVSEPIPVK